MQRHPDRRDRHVAADHEVIALAAPHGLAGKAGVRPGGRPGSLGTKVPAGIGSVAALFPLQQGQDVDPLIDFTSRWLRTLLKPVTDKDKTQS